MAQPRRHTGTGNRFHSPPRHLTPMPADRPQPWLLVAHEDTLVSPWQRQPGGLTYEQHQALQRVQQQLQAVDSLPAAVCWLDQTGRLTPVPDPNHAWLRARMAHYLSFRI